MSEDRDLAAADIQVMSSRDGVASFFAALGYNTDVRLPQTSAAMGITAESLQRHITHIEQVAAGVDGAEPLYVYLVELKSVTIAATQGLVRALRNRGGNYLLILTSDYEQLDFVLLERSLPVSSSIQMAARQVTARPRILTVDRRNPSQLQLRVLRRFTKTEADSDAQYDKLLSAYTVAEWSEPLFNNRALFSDYYLNQRLPERPEWRERSEDVYHRLRDLLAAPRERLVGQGEANTRQLLIEPALEALGFSVERRKVTPENNEPDYRLYHPDVPGKPVVVCLAYVWNRYLDGRDETRDDARRDENPGARVVSLLDASEASWAIVTNGKLWRLYSASAHSRATNYYEIDLEETLAAPDPNLAFRYFWLLFRAAAFKPKDVVRDGLTRAVSFLDELVAESASYAKALEERLKDRVFEEVFPHFAEGFIEHLKATAALAGPQQDSFLSIAKQLALRQEPNEQFCRQVFQGTLTFLYRLLFLLYAESRDLLPVKEMRGYWEKSLTRLKEEVAGKAGRIEDQVPSALRKAYGTRANSTVLYDRLLELFAILDQGSCELNVPVYNGGLFLCDPDPNDDTPEAANARFLLSHKIPDRYLALGLDRLTRDGASLGLRPRAATQLLAELNAAQFTEETLRAVEDLIAFLRRDNVEVRAYQQGFLHAKCYLFYGDLPVGGADRFQPVAAIVGSSNFTGPGLTTNKELNLSHKAVLSEEEILDAGPISSGDSDELQRRAGLMNRVGAQAITELDRWFRRHWEQSRDFKQELIDLLDSSKFGEKEYTPYQIYMKALFEYFKDDLGADVQPVGRSAIDLSEFQEDAVKKARKILARYDGVLIGDSVGLGKTWIGKKLLEDYAYHQRQKALVICPASLRKMWTDELHDATIAATIVSQEELGQEDFDPNSTGDADIILIDESHNFRNRSTQRYENLERIINSNAGRGRDGGRKKLILVTATPISNNIFDLYNQITLFTGGDRSYFAGVGIGDLYRYFLSARRDGSDQATGITIFNLLEEVVIRRTRSFIRKAYPEAKIKDKPIRWPDRKLKTVRYDLEATYAGIYDRIVDAIEGLRMAPYQLETYKKSGVKRDEFEQGREEALAGIFRSRYLKRFESSVEAFRISMRRALEFTKTFESYLLDGKLLDSASFEKAMRYVAKQDEEDDGTPTSRADEMDATKEARELLESLPRLDPANYDLRRLHDAIQYDVDALTDIWRLIQDIKPEQDAKLKVLKGLLAADLKGRKVIVFTYYRDTARYLYRELGGDRGIEFRHNAGDPVIRRMDSGASPRERTALIQAFAPRSNNRPDLLGSDKEVDVLISTDVLSEGQNLQDCGVLVNYDLHWNPTRMVQRAGRIDRIGSDYPVLWIYNMFPDEGLERLLRLVENLSRKIEAIDRTGFLDASVLGEAVHPRNFNTLRRIMEEDGRVIEEQEQFVELASNEFLLLQLRSVLESGAQKMLEELPDGIHSGLARQRERGIFFYYTGPGAQGSGRRHFWRYFDLNANKVVDNRYLIANLIACSPDTPRVVGDVDVFEVQEKVIEDILRSVREQQAVEAAPKILDPLQQTVLTLLRSYLNSPVVKRKEVKDAMQRLGKPMTHTSVRDLRRAYDDFLKDQDIQAFLDSVNTVNGAASAPVSSNERRFSQLTRDDLHLVCFDFVWS